MRILLLACSTFLLIVATTDGKDFTEFDEYIDYYDELDTEAGDEIWADIDDEIEAKEEQYDRYRRQIVIERSRLDQEREIPARGNPGKVTCPAKCTCETTRELHCTFKFLSKIPLGIPRSVEKLNLGFNKIVDLPSGSFDNYSPTLRYLYLHSNDIRSIGTGLFSKLGKIQVLRLSWNKITGIRKTSLHGLVNVERLYLDNNRLSFIHPLALRGLTNLILLHLNGNRLSRLHRSVFLTLEFHKYFRYSSIEYLYLAKNKLSHLPRHIFDDMQELKYVYLHGNKWDCSCEMRWIKTWIEQERKYKCKKNSRRRHEGEDCAVCAWPPTLKGKQLQEVSRSDFTCISPVLASGAIMDPSDFDPNSLDRENEIALFRYSGFYSVQLNLRLDNYRRSMLFASCYLAKTPSVTVKSRELNSQTSAKSYFATFEGQFRCLPEYPTRSKTLQRLLQPYIGHEMNLTRRQVKRHIGDIARSYSISISRLQKRPVTLLTAGSISSASKFLLSKSVLMMIQPGDIDLQTNSFFVNFQTSFNHTHDLDPLKYSKHPWLIIRQPEPSTVAVVLTLERKTATCRCKAVGRPRPKITWILPNGEALRSGEQTSRFSVSRSGRLLIRKAFPGDSGYYRCIATIPESRNMTRFTSTAAAEISTLKIEVFPRTQDSFSMFDSLSRGLLIERVQAGQNWSSNCNVESLPNATIGWITPNQHLLIGKDESNDSRTYTNENGRITVARFSQPDQGLYRCVFANIAGSAEYSIFVSIPSNDNELIKTIEQPETENHGQTTGLRTTDLTPHVDAKYPETSDDRNQSSVENFKSEPVGDSRSRPKENTMKQTKVQTAPTTPNISSPVASPLTSPVYHIIHPNLESPKVTSPKYSNFLDTPTSFDSQTVVAISRQRTHRPEEFSSTAGKRSDSGLRDEVIPLLGAQDKDQIYPAKCLKHNLPLANFLPNPPRGLSPAKGSLHESIRYAAAYVNRTVLTSQVDPSIQHGPQSSMASSIGNVATPTSTTSESTSTESHRPSTSLARQNPLSSRRRVTSTNRGGYSPRRILVPARRIQGGGIIEVPAKSIHRPGTTQRQRGAVLATQGGGAILPCNSGNRYANRRNFEWTLPSGEIYKRPGRVRSSDFTKFIYTNGSLFLQWLTSRDSGLYTCVAAGRSYGIEYHTQIRLFVQPNRPRILNPTREDVTVNAGYSLAIPCDANGIPVPTVSWRTPLGTTIPGKSINERFHVFRNGTLYIYKIQSHEYGSYTCTATSSGGTQTRIVIVVVTSRPTAQTNTRSGEQVRLAPVFTVEQTDISPGSGDANSRPSVTSSVSNVTTTFGSTTAQPRPLVTSSISNVTTTFESTPAQPRPRVTSSISNVTTTFESATAQPRPLATSSISNVTATFESTTAQPRPLVTSSISQETTPLSSSVMVAQTSSMLRSPVTSSNPEVTTAPLRITSTGTRETTDEGVEDESAECSTDPPAAAGDRNAVVFGIEGDRINFPCFADSENYPSNVWKFEWTLPSREVYRRPGRIFSQDWTRFVHRNGSLSLHSLKSRDTGTYSCVATNNLENNEYHSEVKLIVRSNRPRISNPAREYVRVKAGDSLAVDCNASGVTAPRVTWRTPWGTTIQAGSMNGRIEVFHNGTLYVSKIKPLEYGSYTCVAESSGQTQRRTVVVWVTKHPPRFLGQRQGSIKAAAGDKVTFSCAAAGHPPPRHYWLLPTRERIGTNQAIFRTGHIRESKYRVKTDGTLILSRAAESDNGRYHCVISNSVGRAASTINLIVKE